MSRLPTEDHMTEQQLELWNNFQSKVESVYEKCLRKAKECEKAIVKLPNTAHTGHPVQHRANLTMMEMQDYYTYRAILVVKFIDRLKAEEIKKRVENE